MDDAREHAREQGHPCSESAPQEPQDGDGGDGWRRVSPLPWQTEEPQAPTSAAGEAPEPGSGSQASGEELPAVDPEHAATEVVKASLKARNHDEKGRFTVGNQVNVRTAKRSEYLWKGLDDTKRELIARVTADLGVNGDTPATLESVISGYVEARLLRHSMFARIQELDGPITGKGRVRALLSAYMSALDREVRLAQSLGLERKAKKVPTLSELLTSHEEERP